jgi:hypothetical protein
MPVTAASGKYVHGALVRQGTGTLFREGSLNRKILVKPLRLFIVIKDKTYYSTYPPKEPLSGNPDGT